MYLGGNHHNHNGGWSEPDGFFTLWEGHKIEQVFVDGMFLRGVKKDVRKKRTIKQ